MSLQYYGMLGLPHSWAVVSTEIMLQLLSRGRKFHCTSTNGTDTVHPNLKSSLILPQYQMHGGVRRQVIKPPFSTTSISYTIPQNLLRVPAKNKLHIYNYETTIMPKGWGQQMNSNSTLILPSSEFSKQIFAANGVSSDKMFVLPHGFDPTIYNPSVSPVIIKDLDPQKFKFLTVAISHWRKGHDILFRSYIEEFKDDDSVVLIVKTSKDAQEKSIPVHIDVNQLVSELKKTHNYKWPEIRIIDSRFDNLARLYNACDALVLPTRTECFSLTVLEAAACKKPVITTGYGGHLDFLNKDNSWLIDYSMRYAPEAGQYWEFNPKAECAEPSVEHLRQLMRTVKNNYEEAQAKAEKAYLHVSEKYTWHQVVDSLIVECNSRGILL